MRIYTSIFFQRISFVFFFRKKIVLVIKEVAKHYTMYRSLCNTGEQTLHRKKMGPIGSGSDDKTGPMRKLQSGFGLWPAAIDLVRAIPVGGGGPSSSWAAAPSS